MKKLFKNAKPGQKVILTNGLGVERQTTILEVTKRSIRVNAANVYRFNRDGTLNKQYTNNGKYKITIKPID